VKKLLTIAIFLIASHQLFAQSNTFPLAGEAGIGTYTIYNPPLTPLHIVASPSWLLNNPTIRLEAFLNGVVTDPGDDKLIGHLSLTTLANDGVYSPFSTLGDMVLQSTQDGEDIILQADNLSGAIRLATNAYERQRITPTGRIDFNIGTWNFGSPRISFEKNGEAPVIKLYHHDGLSYGSYDNISAYPWWIENSGSEGVSALNFKAGPQQYMGSELVTTKVTFLSNGNVGINNMNPQQKLDIVGNIRFSGAVMPANDAGLIGQVLTSQGSGAAPVWSNSGGSNAWLLSGNSGLSSTSFLGLIDKKPLIIKTDNIERFRITEEGALLASGSSGSTPSTAIGAGTRMMWIPAKYAFRAGYINNTQWDNANIGIGSVAFGESNTSSGNYSFSAGYDNTASGIEAVAMGISNTASNIASIALGRNNTSSDLYSVALGNLNSASGENSVALGGQNISSGHGAVALGEDNEASGQASFAAGDNCVATGQTSIAIGYIVEATADYSTVIGTSYGLGANVLRNNIPGSLMVGYNTTKPALFISGGANDLTPLIPNPNTTKIGIGMASITSTPTTHPANMLAVAGSTTIGSGYATTVVPASNSLMVQGAVLIGGTSLLYDPSLTPASLNVHGIAIQSSGNTSWSTTSDIRLKKDVKPFNDGLEQLRQINPVRFHYNGKLNLDSTKEKIGVIAQEIQKIAPYTIEEGTYISKKVIRASEYVAIEVPDTAHPGKTKTILEYVPEIIEDEKTEVLVYNPTAVTYIIINAIKELDSIVTLYKSLDTELQRVSVENQEIRLRLSALEEEIAQIKASKGEGYDTFEDVLLEQNNPNPFSENTTIIYFVPERIKGIVELVVTNATGNSILQRYPVISNIPHQQEISARDLDTGVYIYGIAINGQIVKSKKMMILK
jgi:hypothetical protein